MPPQTTCMPSRYEQVWGIAKCTCVLMNRYEWVLGIAHFKPVRIYDRMGELWGGRL